jgi:hypothetical protein
MPSGLRLGQSILPSFRKVPMRAFPLLLVITVLTSGCASSSLQHYTLNQAMTVSDMRYKQVLYDLAVIADNSGNLPSFALTAGGIANVTNTVSVDTATLWAQAVKGFSQETLTAFGQHNPELQWTLDPVVSEPQLEALGYACMWALYGPPDPTSHAMEVLRPLTFDDVSGVPANGVKKPPGYHFGVSDQLYRLPQGWVQYGDKKCIPHDAVYSAIYGKTAVWVMKEGLPWLSEFTLVILDISTIDSKTLVAPTPTVQVTFTEPKNDYQANAPGFVTKLSDDSKITEQWNVCQYVNVVTPGQILLSRPKAFSQTILESPAPDAANISFKPTGPIPQFILTGISPGGILTLPIASSPSPSR